MTSLNLRQIQKLPLIVHLKEIKNIPKAGSVRENIEINDESQDEIFYEIETYKWI